LLVSCHREREEGRRDQDSGPYVLADQLLLDILESLTFSQFLAVIQDASPVNSYEDTPLVLHQW
jgi:hypothetical protein